MDEWVSMRSTRAPPYVDGLLRKSTTTVWSSVIMASSAAVTGACRITQWSNCNARRQDNEHAFHGRRLGPRRLRCGESPNRRKISRFGPAEVSASIPNGTARWCRSPASKEVIRATRREALSVAELLHGIAAGSEARYRRERTVP